MSPPLLQTLLSFSFPDFLHILLSPSLLPTLSFFNLSYCLYQVPCSLLLCLFLPLFLFSSLSLVLPSRYFSLLFSSFLIIIFPSPLPSLFHLQFFLSSIIFHPSILYSFFHSFSSFLIPPLLLFPLAFLSHRFCLLLLSLLTHFCLSTFIISITPSFYSSFLNFLLTFHYTFPFLFLCLLLSNFFLNHSFIFLSHFITYSSPFSSLLYIFPSLIYLISVYTTSLYSILSALTSFPISFSTFS